MGHMLVFGWAALAATISSLSEQSHISEANAEDAMRNSPLLLARHELLVARSRVVEHRFSEAIPPLLTTAHALAFFEAQEIGGNDGIDAIAGDARQQILDYAAAIQTDNTYAVSDIDGWLKEIRQWNKHPAIESIGRVRSRIVYDKNSRNR
jgi:hypothetical protein